MIRVLSLFSGCGGLDLGFEGNFDALINGNNWQHLPKTRFTTIFANDINPDARIAWLNYFNKFDASNDVYKLGSIVNFVKAHKVGEFSFPQNVDIVTGGFPCQDFSIAGKRLGFKSSKSHVGGKHCSDAPTEESRGKLYMWMREVIEITRPKLFVAENVKGLTNLDNVKSIIENDFRSVGDNGYLVVPAKILHAANYGVPQSRERVIFIGFNRSHLNARALHELSMPTICPGFDPYPPPTHEYTKKGNNLLPPITVSEALAGLDEPDISNDLSQQRYSKAKYMGKHCQGQTEVRLDDIAPTIRAEHHGNIEFRRLSLENGGKHVSELEKGLIERRLTVRECARIQTFPDDYEFVFPPKNDIKGVSASAAYKLIGNAVPPLLGYAIAKRIEENWELYFGEEDTQ
ncbi:MAG: DNA (cytosine-5-)-methyltransferase [Defluviitaleaceae bacterium]|nr:DNA (cytosine-5-)-methyltransferase [Defluviitaleaceae bacterium]